jgi:glycosyltransferase involved in cell wall biosynthesis
MQILIISSKFPYPLKDGGAIATYSLTKGLSEQNNQVFILSFNTKKHFISKESVPEDKFKNIEFELVEINTDIHFFRAFFNLLFSRKPYILQRFKSNNFKDTLIRLLNSRKFDIIQIEGLYMMQYIDLIRQYSTAKIAYRPHNLEHRIWKLLSENTNNQLKKIYFKILSNRIFRYERKILNSYDIILPISPYDASYFEKTGNVKPIAVVPAGFETARYPKVFKAEPNHKLCYIGSLEWIPNHEGIIWFINHCWGTLKQNFPALELHIAGRNTPKWLIEEYSRPGIFWAGEVEEIQDFIKDKSIMIVPLFSGSGMRVKIIEAFLSFKAVVATAIAVQGTGAADNCELLIADGHLEFTNKISNLITNSKLYQRLVDDAYKFSCMYFDNAQISQELNELYTGLYK